MGAREVRGGGGGGGSINKVDTAFACYVNFIHYLSETKHPLN